MCIVHFRHLGTNKTGSFTTVATCKTFGRTLSILADIRLTADGSNVLLFSRYLHKEKAENVEEGSLYISLTCCCYHHKCIVIAGMVVCAMHPLTAEMCKF